ncbi:hypothetical protein BH18ACT1_BH18ACT1_01120 [soil metagenome]
MTGADQLLNGPTIGAVRRARGTDPEAVRAAALERVVAVLLDGHRRLHALTRLADAHESLRRGTRHRAQIAAELRSLADGLAA